MANLQEEKPISKPDYEQDIITHIRDCFQISDNWRKSGKKEPQWEEIHRSYRHIEDRTGKEGWQCSFVVPMTSKNTEIVASSLHETLIGPRKFFTIDPYYKTEDSHNQAEMKEDLILWDIEKGQAKIPMSDAFQEAALYGTSYIKVSYSQAKRFVKVKNPMSGFSGIMQGFLDLIGKTKTQGKWVVQEQLVEDWTKLTFVGIRDLYPQPGAIDFDREHYFIEATKYTNSQIKNEVLSGNFKDYPDLYQESSEALERRLAEKRADMGEGKSPDPATKTEKTHDVLEYWGPLPYNWVFPPKAEMENVSVPGWAILIDDKYLVKCRDNPFRDALPPYKKMNYIRVAGEWYGKGIGEQLKGTQKEANELRNQRVDNVNLILNTQFLINSDFLKDYDRVVSKPGNFIIVEGVDDVRKAIQPLKVQDVTITGYRESLDLERQAQEETGVVRATMGTGGSTTDSNSTFHGQVFNKQMAMERFMYYAKIIEYSFLMPLIKMIYDRVYQYKSPQQVEKILGPDRFSNFKMETPEELELNCAYTPLGTISMQSKFVVATFLSQFEAIWRGAPFINHIEIAKTQLREMQIHDTAKYFVEPQAYGPGVMNEPAINLTDRIEGGRAGSPVPTQEQPGLASVATPAGGESPNPILGLS